MLVHVISHPEVVVDPATPVPRWHLRDSGIARMRALARRMPAPGAVWASSETKAIEAAGLLAAWHGLPVHVQAGLDEIDRSATGFLPHAEHDEAADACFARPQESFRGWERAADAQARMLAAVDEILTGHREGSLAIVTHGGVGTLLLCHLLGVPIDRRLDQPGQGHVWRFDGKTRQVLTQWEPIENA